MVLSWPGVVEEGERRIMEVRVLENVILFGCEEVLMKGVDVPCRRVPEELYTCKPLLFPSPHFPY